jgi:hypothetical protein
MKLPNVISRQLCKIDFKSKASLLHHALYLLASYSYSQGNPCTWRKRNAALHSRLGQARGLKATHSRHAAACLQGYRAKQALVAKGKGHNSLSGIPA